MARLSEVLERAGFSIQAQEEAEDLIILKLIANPTRDRIDLIGLCDLPDIDWSYVDRWARAWGLCERLEKIKRAARE